MMWNKRTVHGGAIKHSHLATPARLALAQTLCFALLVGVLPAQTPCPDEPPLPNHFGTGSNVCACFVAGEEVGAVFEAPAAHYPLEVVRVSFEWQSMFGGQPDTTEQSICVYAGGLPNPGAPIAQLPGPTFVDGGLNEFDLEALTGQVLIASGPFTVTVRLQNTSAGNLFAPSVVDDQSGCTPGRNVVFVIPGGWIDACSAGVGGDWKMQVVYRQTTCGGQSFVRGDCNSDSLFNIADAVAALNLLFGGGATLCHSACDANDDGSVNIADPVYTLAALFAGGLAPPAPQPGCGSDPTADTLTCEDFSACP